jgi:hypothetical protein
VSRRGGISERPVSPTEPLNLDQRADIDRFFEATTQQMKRVNSGTKNCSKRDDLELEVS